jgi:hypothetical protein
MSRGPLVIVTAEAVTDAIADWRVWAMMAELPTWEPEEWAKDHGSFILGLVMPAVRPADWIRRIVTEAYLAGMEAQSDGSSLVPDSARYGNVKDWQGVAHDYVGRLHVENRPDAFGHRWTFWESNWMYNRAWAADGQPLRGWLWWAGLTAGYWPRWWAFNRPLVSTVGGGRE